MLVLLRVTIGWHFLFAGLEKLTSPNFSSAGFLGQAKGPLADKFHDMIPDWDGRERLSKDYYPNKMRAHLAEFDQYYHLSEEQRKAAEAALKLRSDEVKDFLAEKKADLDSYFNDLKRLEDAQQEPSKTMPFQQKRNWDRQTALRAQLTSWAATLEGTYTEFEEELSDLRTPEQIKQGDIPLPVTALLTQDNIVTYSNLAVGVCLIAGLFTRLAALGGALFLLPIVLAQPDWPGLYPAPPPSAGRTFLVSKEFVEMMALFMLATTRVGRWGGLDFFIHHLFVRPIFSRGKAP